MSVVMRVRVVRIDDCAVPACGKRAVCAEQFRLVVIAVRMIEIGVEHDRDIAPEPEETAAEFARLGQEVFPARAAVIAEFSVFSADMTGERTAPLGKNMRKHRRR